MNKDNQNDYMQKTKTANFIFKRKKKEWINDKINEAEEMKPRNSIKAVHF
jgi:hypothetical protein